MSARDLWLVLAGAVASSVNAAAGGGTLLSFPALIAGGLNPLAANATSTVALLPGQLTSLWAYRREIVAARSDAALIALPGLFGGAAGAWLLLHLGNRVFEIVVPVLLLSAAALLVLQPVISRWVAKRNWGTLQPEGRRERALVPALLLSFGVAVYFGYFGAGGGILFMGAMAFVLTSRPLGEINALKVEIASVANLIAASVFIASEVRSASGAVHWRAALPLAAGGILGGYFGVNVVRRLSPNVLRAIAACVGLGIGVYLAVRR